MYGTPNPPRQKYEHSIRDTSHPWAWLCVAPAHNNLENFKEANTLSTALSQNSAEKRRMRAIWRVNLILRLFHLQINHLLQQALIQPHNPLLFLRKVSSLFEGNVLPASGTAKCLGYLWHHDLSAKPSIDHNILKARKSFFAYGSMGVFQGDLSPCLAARWWIPVSYLYYSMELRTAPCKDIRFFSR